MQLWGVQGRELNLAWYDAARLIERVPDRDKTLSEIYHGIRNKSFQLWAAWEHDGIKAVLITQTYRLNGEQICSLFILAGDDMRRWFHYLPTIEEWALSKGCKAMQLVGRKGWGRVLKPHGYRVAGRDNYKYIIRKELKK